MRTASLTRIAGACAVLTTACFVAGIVLMSVGGVQVLIPETGKDGLDWIADVDDAGGLFDAGGWLVVLGGTFALVALVGFYGFMFIGFLAFFVWITAMGVALLRGSRAERDAPVPVLQ